jgi:hypothetical protein
MSATLNATATLRRLSIDTPWTATSFNRFTIFTSLAARAVPAGVHIDVTCKGGGCPFVHRRLTVAAPLCNRHKKRTCRSSGRSKRDVELAPLVRHAHLSINAKLIVTFTLRFYVGQVRAFTVEPAGPILRTTCLAPGATRPGQGC